MTHEEFIQRMSELRYESLTNDSQYSKGYNDGLAEAMKLFEMYKIIETQRKLVESFLNQPSGCSPAEYKAWDEQHEELMATYKKLKAYL